MEYITTETPITISDVTLIPVVRICLHSSDIKMGYELSANKEPLAIIVCDKNGVRAFDVNSSDIAISTLLQKIPDLGTVLLAYQNN